MDDSTVSEDPNPSGICQCGECGQPTTVWRWSNKPRGQVRGHHARYVKGHYSRQQHSYTVDDRGFETHCWTWAGGRTEAGYAKQTRDSTMQYMHIAYWERENGPVPKGAELDHLCRNRDCIRPSHCEPVTHLENCRRGAKTKLSPDQILDMRRRVRAGESRASIARSLGVSAGHVCNIINGREWADVQEVGQDA